jgi:hypothetical protein
MKRMKNLTMRSPKFKRPDSDNLGSYISIAMSLHCQGWQVLLPNPVKYRENDQQWNKELHQYSNTF